MKTNDSKKPKNFVYKFQNQNKPFPFKQNQNKSFSFKKNQNQQFTPRNPQSFQQFSQFPQSRSFQPQSFPEKHWSVNKPMSQQNRFPTNNQVFGSQAAGSSRTYKPTPMSIQSRVRTFYHQAHI